MFILLLLCLVLSVSASASEPVNNAPTMGWSSWNTYRVNISDSLIMDQANALVERGLKDLGYHYINIDDGFWGGRDENGKLLFNPVKFPNGLKPVVDHIHSLGLKAGIYSDAGGNTCGNVWDNDTIAVGVGLWQHDDQDAQHFFNEIGFDFLKVDFCGGDPRKNKDSLDLDERERYQAIHDAILRTGHDDIRLNICRWDYPGTWVDSIGFSWRISHDITNRWESMYDIIRQGIPLSAYCRNGGFNDMDMLEVGRGLTADEDITHFGLWCIMSSPLMIGCDLRGITDSALELLTNTELIALNQDPLHLQAYPALYRNGCFVLVKDLGEKYGRQRAFAVFNPTDAEQTLTIAFDEIDLGGDVALRDLVARQDQGVKNGSFEVTVPSHGTRMFKATASRRLDRTNFEGEAGFNSCYQEIYNPEIVLTGEYVYDDACSGGMKVTGLGRKADNDLVWDNVYVSEAGPRDITVYYTTDTPAGMTIAVNGKDYAVSNLEGTGSYTVKAELKAGENTVRLHNATSPMPAIDRMTVTK